MPDIEFNDRFIAAVQKRPILWNSGLSDYKDQRKKSVTGEEIAAELECEHLEKVEFSGGC